MRSLVSVLLLKQLNYPQLFRQLTSRFLFPFLYLSRCVKLSQQAVICFFKVLFSKMRSLKQNSTSRQNEIKSAEERNHEYRPLIFLGKIIVIYCGD